MCGPTVGVAALYCRATSLKDKMSFTRAEFMSKRVSSLTKVAEIDAAFRLATSGTNGIPILGELSLLANNCIQGSTVFHKLQPGSAEDLSALVRNLHATGLHPGEYFSINAVQEMREAGLDTGALDNCDAGSHMS
jgi:hypothetical protein